MLLQIYQIKTAFINQFSNLIKIINNCYFDSSQKMQIPQTPHFTELLQIASFIKLILPKQGEEYPESLRQASFNEIYHNIEENKFETQFIKDLLCFLLNYISDMPKHSKIITQSSVHLLNADLKQYRKDVINSFYLQLALEEMFVIDKEQMEENHQQKGKLYNVFHFCQLERQLKYSLLSKLIYPVMFDLEKIIDKDDNKSEKKAHQDVGRMLMLGEDGSQLYLFAPFIPTHILSLKKKKWAWYNREQIIEKMKQLLKLPQSPRILMLMQNIMTAMQSIVTLSSLKKIKPKIHKVKDAVVHKSKIDEMKSLLLDTLSRYSNALAVYKLVYSPISIRKKVTETIQSAKTYDDLVQAEILFYESSKNLWECDVENQEEIKPDEEEIRYEKARQKTATLHQLRVFKHDKTILLSQTAKKLQQNPKRIDAFPLLAIIILSYQTSSLNYLELKAERKRTMIASKNMIMKEKSFTESECSQDFNSRDNSEDLPYLRKRPKSKKVEKKASLRPGLREGNKKKMMIDSDDSDDSFEATGSNTLQEQFKRYELR